MRSKRGAASDTLNIGECQKFEASRRHSRSLSRKPDRMSDDENRRLTQKPILELADNGSEASYIIVGATARVRKEYGNPYIDYPRMLMKAI